MKKRLQHYTLLLGIATSALVFVPACKSSQRVPKGETELSIYCNGKGYTTDKKFFRANAIGESIDQMAAKKKAYSNAQTELASSINLTVKAVVDNYVNSREFDNAEQLEERFEALSRQVINEQLRDVATICEKHTRTQEGKYKSYLAIEMSKEAVVEGLSERISNDEQLRIDYDYEKFKRTFEDEMKELR